MANPLRGEVWLVDLGMVAKIRPCLIFSIPAQSLDGRRQQSVRGAHVRCHRSRRLRCRRMGIRLEHAQRSQPPAARLLSEHWRLGGCPRAIHLRHGPCWARMWRLADDAAASAESGLPRAEIHTVTDSQSRSQPGWASHWCPARCLLTPARRAAQFTPGSRTTRRTRPPLTPSDREYTAVRSADKHFPEAN